MKRHFYLLALLLPVLIYAAIFAIPTLAFCQAYGPLSYGARTGPSGPLNGAQLSAQSAQAAALDAQRKAIDLAYRRGKAVRDAQKTYQDSVLEAQNKLQQAQIDARKSSNPADMAKAMQGAASTYNDTVRSSAKTYNDAVRAAQTMK